MSRGLIASVSIDIDAPVSAVWNALTDPEMTKAYMFGAEVASEWKAGSPITWSGTWHNKPFQDKGTVLKIEPRKILQFSHFSALSGAPDIPENYHTVTYELSEKNDHTVLALSQDNNDSEKSRKESQKNWGKMLDSLKKVLEK